MAIPARQALTRLQEGNRRFASRAPGAGRSSVHAHPFVHSEEQRPFAVILGCADARVPAEIVFDQGLGDLFVVRVAGNIVAPSLIGSVEYAASVCGARLVVVLGHSGCGAIQTTLEEVRRPSGRASRNLQSIVDFIRPSVEDVLVRNPGADEATMLIEAMRANVRASVERLRSGSTLLDALIREDGLAVVGAEYSLDDGTVEFIEGLPVAD